MRSNIVRTVFVLATLLLSVVVTAAAQNQGNCTEPMVAGPWGYTETGTIYLPTGATPYASVGSYTLDRYGNLSGERYASTAGKIQKAIAKGTATLNPDCTGTVTINLYDQSGNLLSTVVKALVYVDNAKEVRGIIISVTLPNGGSVPVVLTLNGKRI